MANRLLTPWLLAAALAVGAGATGQPQKCMDIVGEPTCRDAGCRWATVGSAAANGPTCTRQCHEFGGAAQAGTPQSQIDCVSPGTGCRWIVHPTNTALAKCGKLCAEFKVETNCNLAGYSSCRWAAADITGGPPKCTKQCVTITDPTWCEGASCIWMPDKGSCRRKCIEFQMQGPCEQIGCDWVTAADGYALSQCIPPGSALPNFVNQTRGFTTKENETNTFVAEGQTFKRPVFAKGKKFMQVAKIH